MVGMRGGEVVPRPKCKDCIDYLIFAFTRPGTCVVDINTGGVALRSALLAKRTAHCIASTREDFNLLEKFVDLLSQSNVNMKKWMSKHEAKDPLVKEMMVEPTAADGLSADVVGSLIQDLQLNLGPLPDIALCTVMPLATASASASNLEVQKETLEEAEASTTIAPVDSKLLFSNCFST